MTGEIAQPRLETGAKLFHDGGMSIRHVDMLSQALDSCAARRIPADDWATAERYLAEAAPQYTPRQLGVLATDLITTLDQDGPEPDERAPNVNELRITRHRDGGGTIVAVLDAKSAPQGRDDQRSELADREQRARRASLDTGDRLTPAQLRMLACDADVIPVVLNGAGQPVDVGRKRRTVPEPLRRAVAARDRGCAPPTPRTWCCCAATITARSATSAGRSP